MPDTRETDVQTWREIEVSVVTGIWSTTDAAPPGPTVARARRCTGQRHSEDQRKDPFFAS
jgi:hypothetical protein